MKHEVKNETYAKQLRKDMTPWERKLWYCFLKDYPIRFQRQKCIDNYIVDFYCFKAKLVIELDGGGHYEPIQKQKDDERTKVLKSYGLKVLRFCNLDIDKNFYGVCTVIEREVQGRVAPPAPPGHPPRKRGGQEGTEK
jgi:very-short-patch-repair endonuclease